MEVFSSRASQDTAVVFRFISASGAVPSSSLTSCLGTNDVKLVLIKHLSSLLCTLVAGFNAVINWL